MKKILSKYLDRVYRLINYTEVTKATIHNYLPCKYHKYIMNTYNPFHLPMAQGPRILSCKSATLSRYHRHIYDASSIASATETTHASKR